jgi:hypothetical protein
MDPLYVGLLIGLVIGFLLFPLLFYVRYRPTGEGLSLGLAVLEQASRDPAKAKKVRELVTGPVKAEPAKPSGEPLRLLALLQREGRLLDFLLEDVKNYPDAQIGVAVRDIHQKCQAALKEHLELEPVMPQSEGATVTVPAGFDPSAVRLTGNVTGQPPFSGTLQHHGWKVAKLKLAPPPAGQDEFVVQPAEVEIP